MGIFLATVTLLLGIGLPIFVALGLTVSFVLSLEGTVPLGILVQRMFSGIDTFPLMAIPFFILAGNLMTGSGLSRRLIKLAVLIVGPMPGGLAMTTVASCTFFGAISGSSPATVVAIGKIMFPAMLNGGYSRDFSIGTIMASGSLGIMIPPSIFFIVFGAVTGVSIGALFLGGIGVGIVYSICIQAYCYFYGRRHGIKAETRPTLSALWKATKGASLAIAIPVIILGGIYGGIFTPTEAAAVAVVYALFVGVLIYREITMSDLFRILVESATTTAQVMIVVAAATAFSWYLTTSGATVAAASAFLGISNNPIVIFLIINVIVLIAGMFIDPNSIIVILVPLLFSVAATAGINPIHLGVVLCVNASIGMYTPPFGLNLFVARGVGEVTYREAVKGSIPFIWVALIALVIATFIPEISLWIPRSIYRGVG